MRDKCEHCNRNTYRPSYVSKGGLYTTEVDGKYVCYTCWDKYVKPYSDRVKSNYAAIGINM